MSGGRLLAPPEEQSNDNCKDLIHERIFNEIKELREKFLFSFDEINKIKSQNQSYISELDLNKRKIERHVSEYKTNKDSYDLKLSSLESNIIDQSKQLENSSSSLNQGISRVECSFKEYNDKIEKLEKIDYIQKELNDLNKFLNAFNERTNLKLNSLESKLGSIEYKINAHESLHKDNHEYFESVIESLKSIEDKSNNLFKSERKQTDNCFKNLESKLSEEINDLRISLQKNPQLSEKLKDEYDKKIMSISLTADNSWIKASNFEKQIIILEKKIENLSLLVKQLQLEG